MPTIEDLKYSIRDKATLNKLHAVEKIEVESDAYMLLQYLKNEYTQKEILESLHKYIDTSIAFEGACAACHNVAEGAKHKTGPNLWKIHGAKAGIQDGYKYSEWLKGSGIVWNDEELAAWVSAKKVKVAKFGKDVKKSKMIFAGLRKQVQIDDMIAYLKSLK